VPELSVVVPAFRERENIPALLQALEQALAGLDWETIVVVDGAFDGTKTWCASARSAIRGFAAFSASAGAVSLRRASRDAGQLRAVSCGDRRGPAAR